MVGAKAGMAREVGLKSRQKAEASEGGRGYLGAPFSDRAMWARANWVSGQKDIKGLIGENRAWRIN